MALNIRYNSVFYTDKGVATLVSENVKRELDSCATIKKQIDWIISNCTNVHDLAVVNAMQYLWYNIIGISNNNLWRMIDEYTQDMVEAGKIKEW